MLQGHGYGASVSRGMPVYSPAFAGTKLYCLVTEAHRCEKLDQSFYAAVPGRDSNPRPLDRMSDTLPQHHDANNSTVICWSEWPEKTNHVQFIMGVQSITILIMNNLLVSRQRHCISMVWRRELLVFSRFVFYSAEKCEVWDLCTVKLLSILTLWCFSYQLCLQLTDRACLGPSLY